MAIRQEGNTYYGLSTDTKPTGAVLNGREFREMDTGKKYLFDEENGEWLEQPEEGGGGGGGSSTLAGLTDVDISNPSDGQTLVYNATAQKWENGSGGGVLRVVENYDDQTQTATLSETWKTIYDAVSNGVLVFLVFTMPSEDAGMPDSKYVAIIDQVFVSAGVYFVQYGNMAYGTLTQDGYPESPTPAP